MSDIDRTTGCPKFYANTIADLFRELKATGAGTITLGNDATLDSFWVKVSVRSRTGTAEYTQHCSQDAVTLAKYDVLCDMVNSTLLAVQEQVRNDKDES